MMADGNSPINMNNSYLYGLPNPVGGDDAANKTYVDNRDNLNLPLNGSRAMTGNINMGGNAIKNIKPFVEDDSSQAAQNAQLNDVINFGYFHAQRGELKREINDVSYEALNRKNPDPMEDNIDMNNHRMKGLSDGNENDDAVTVKQLNEVEDNVSKYITNKITDSNTNIKSIIDQKIKESKTSSIDLVDQENVFKIVMDDDLFKEDDDDIHKVGAQNENFHSVNKKTYEFKIDYDSSIGYYSTRLSIDLIYLPIGSYTMVYEMYVDDGITIDEIDAVSGTLSVGKTNSRIDGTNTRSIIHFNKNTIHHGFDDLDIDIKLKSKTDPQTTIYVVVYGVKGYVNNVSVNLWDRLYYYDNDSVQYEVPIDMKGNKITGVAVDDSDAINYKQLNTLINYYTYTNDLKHNNASIVKFPVLNISSHWKPQISFPFEVTSNDHNILKLKLDGWYQIIYYDNIKYGSQFVIYNRTQNINIYSILFAYNDFYTPFCVNSIFKITINKNISNHIAIQLKLNKLVSFNKNPVMEGSRFSSFYIKYLHPYMLMIVSFSGLGGAQKSLTISGWPRAGEISGSGSEVKYLIEILM